MNKIELFSLEIPRGSRRKQDDTFKGVSLKLKRALGTLDKTAKRLLADEKESLWDFVEKNPAFKSDYVLSGFVSDGAYRQVSLENALAEYVTLSYGTSLSYDEMEDAVREVYGMEEEEDVDSEILQDGKEFLREFCEDCNIDYRFSTPSDERAFYRSRRSWNIIEDINACTDNLLPLSFIAHNLDDNLGYAYFSTDGEGKEINVIASREARLFEDYKERLPKKKRAKIEKMLEFFDTPLPRGAKSVLTPTHRCVVFMYEYFDGSYDDCFDTTEQSIRPFYKELLVELHEELVSLRQRYGG